MALALLTLIVSRSDGVMGILSGPGGFSGEAELARRELKAEEGVGSDVVGAIAALEEEEDNLDNDVYLGV